MSGKFAFGLIVGLCWATQSRAQPTTYSCVQNSSATNPTQTWCTDPNFPYYGQPSVPLQSNPNASPGDGLTLNSGATNLVSYVFGSAQANANILSTLDVYNNFFLDCGEGDLEETAVSNGSTNSPVDTCQTNREFFGVARHYNIGAAYNLHVVQSDGLHLSAHCDNYDTSSPNCSAGNVYAGWIRLPAIILPGQIIKVRYKAPVGMHSWTPIWLFSSTQLSPGPQPQPSDGSAAYNAGLNHISIQPLEIDMNDNYCRFYNNPPVACGQQLDYLMPAESNSTTTSGGTTSPRTTVSESVVYNFWANSNGYVYNPATASDSRYGVLPINWSQSFHDLVLVLSPRSQTTGKVVASLLVDGDLVSRTSFIYNTDTTSSGIYGNPDTSVNPGKQVGLRLMIGNQPVPLFDPSATISDNDGITEGWTIVVQEISVWGGSLAAYPNAGTNGCNTKTC